MKRVDFLPQSGEPFPTAYELQATYEAALRRAREQHGAAPTTVEALMWGFRSKGLAHLKEPSCQRRLSELSPQQREEIIRRLIYCRVTYPGRDPGITDELMLTLKGLFHEAAPN
jgi:hypothetical protein